MKSFLFKYLLIFFTVNILTILIVSGQNQIFTRQDTLRGSVTAGRSWWDLIYYHLDVAVNPSDSSVKGTNTINYKVIRPYNVMQIDLQSPMNLDQAVIDGRSLAFRRDGNVYWIDIPFNQVAGKVYSIILSYGGKPRVSVRPPWSGGLTWTYDSNGKSFIANSNQGDGASLWWPCKDHMYDEPDSMLISVTVPDKLIDISNGRLRSIENRSNGTKTFNWFVSNPINNYGVNINIGDYVHFSEVYNGEKGPLDCDYYVLRSNIEKAKVQFRQVPMMLKAFEHWFGPYPFYEDSYKLVEAPYLGMEHQSSVTYGNRFENGYLGTDLSGTGWGLKFDFIIVHESAHEWFANSITYSDIADMWVHESFTNYAENLYVEFYYGKEAGSAYVIGTRKRIRNDRPIIGKYNVNNEGSGDMYYKGGNMLHTIRQIINDDEKWRSVLRGLNSEFYHKVVTGSQIEDYLIEKTGLDLKPVFDQYLRDIRVPVLEYFIRDNVLSYRWTNCIEGFNMAMKLEIAGKDISLNPVTTFKEIIINSGKSNIKADPDYYVEIKEIYPR